MCLERMAAGGEAPLTVGLDVSPKLATLERCRQQQLQRLSTVFRQDRLLHSQLVTEAPRASRRRSRTFRTFRVSVDLLGLAQEVLKQEATPVGGSSRRRAMFVAPPRDGVKRVL
jgi:hypothetical protein